MSSVAYVHWDLDGIVSGVYLLKNGIVDDIFIPYPGFYWIEEEWIDALLGYRKIYILDMIPRYRDLKVLTGVFDKVYMYDHSTICRYINLNDIEVHCYNYPSTSYLIMKHKGLDLSIEVILGLYSDIGDNIKYLDQWPSFKKLLIKYSLDPDKLRVLVDVFNSPIYIPNLKMLYDNVKYLYNEVYNPYTLPDYKNRVYFLSVLHSYINYIIHTVNVIDSYLYVDYYTKYYLIPLIIKRMLTFNKPFIIIDKGYIEDMVQIAVYNPSRNYLNDVLKLWRSGYSCGGGDGFIGVVTKSSELNYILNLIK